MFAAVKYLAGIETTMTEEVGLNGVVSITPWNDGAWVLVEYQPDARVRVRWIPRERVVYLVEGGEDGET